MFLCLSPPPKSREDDVDRDGKNDVLHLSIEFSNLGQNVNTVQLVLFFHVQLSVSVVIWN